MEQLSTNSFTAIGAHTQSLDSDIESPALRGLLAHWKQRRGERTMPARGDLADETLSQALGDVILFELSCAQAPCSSAAETEDGLTAGMAQPFHEVMRRGQPMYRRRPDAAGMVERLLLPLSRDGVHVDAILVGVQRRRH